MTYDSILTSAWVWAAAAFCGAALAIVVGLVWGVLRMASSQSREEEARERAMEQRWRERRDAETLKRLRAEFEARRSHIAKPHDQDVA